MAALEYKLVEIVDQPPLPPAPDALEKDPSAEQIDVDGKKGQTLAWVEEQNKYIVETFDGDLVAITEDHLKEFEPPSVEEGGFDLAFPQSEGRAMSFQSDLATALTEKKYCVVQMTLKQSDKKAISRQIQDLDNWARFMPEFEPVYMGQRPDGKRVQWYVGGEAGDDPEGEAVGFDNIDQQLTSMALCVCNVAPYLGFNGVCRSNAMMHMNCANSEEELNLLDDARSNAVGAGVIQGHLSFHHRRKVCIIYFVSGSGGTLTLHPPNRGDDDISISCKEGQAVIFRHDIMDYTYLPEGRSLAVQSWVFREQQLGEGTMSQGELLNYADAIDAIPYGPLYGNNGKSIDTMAFATRLPGLVNVPEAYWAGLQSGYDGVIKIPLTRWDHDVYHLPEPELAQQYGRCYTQHEGMLDNEMQMMSFDNEFFGITAEDTQKIDPLARCCMEVGYDCLYRAGWTRQTLKGTKLVLVNGIANGEFEYMQMNQIRMKIESDTRSQINLSVTAARIHYVFGMKGRTSTIETACSSSLTAVALVHSHMRPDQTGQMKLGAGGEQNKYGMAMGANGHFDPFFMVGLCGAKMLSIQGRCFTFDQSGDGFLRSEGEAGMYMKLSEGEDLARLAMICGTCMNQDGRSASLTAPHGPSQQECIRHSLREANIPPLKIQIQELHGTGTALGDPIEVGAVRATMMMYQGEVREHPLVKTSSKSNIGHTELNAGICGIIKCVLMGCYTCACPNNHIRLLNPHIDSNAYPVYFCTEMVDQGKNEGYLGVSSFGFGGSNARGDIWTRAMCGPRNTDPGNPNRPLLTTERLIIWSEVIRQCKPKMRIPDAIANAIDDFDEYDDGYMVGEQPGDDDTLYVIGSFNGWTTPEKMTHVEETGSYIFAMPMGETCVEQFQICMNKNPYFKIFPVTKMTDDQDAIVLGPGIAPAGNHWIIDGRKEGLKPGTIYHITLAWDMETRRKTIAWEPSVDEYMVSLASELEPFYHRYHIIGSWTNWQPLEMMPVRAEKPGTFETTVRVGIMRHEEFRFARDGDRRQAIYPARQRFSETDDASAVYQWTQAGIAGIEQDRERYGNPQVGNTFTSEHLALVAKMDPTFTISTLSAKGYISSSGAQSVPVCGPDHYGEGKYWMVSGFMGEEIKIQLSISDGEIEVTTINARIGIRTWSNQQAALRRKYFVTSTWNNWGYTQMEADPSAEGATVHTLTHTAEEDGMLCFQVVLDEDPAQTLHPEMDLTDQLLSPAMGPDAKGDGHYWGVFAYKGQTMELKLDLSQEDKRRIVTWTMK